MNHIKLTVIGVSLAALGAASYATLQGPVLGSPVAQTPVRLVHAQPFFLDQPYAYDWRADRQQVSSGWIIAVSTDPSVADVRATHDELLFVGSTPVERLNVGAESGVVVGFVPSAATADGGLALDLTAAPIFWAKPDVLPERLTVADAEAVAASSVAQGVTAQRAEAVADATAQGGEAVYLRTQGDLYAYAAQLVARYSPEEADLVEGLTLEPLIK